MRRVNQRGFTIIELMIATVIFTVVLLVVSAGIVQIGRLFYKGMTMSRTQEVSRAVLDEVSRAIQYSPGPIKSSDTIFDTTLQATNPADVNDGPNGEKAICVGSRQFSFMRNRQLNKDSGSSARSLASINLSTSCDVAANLNTAVGAEMLGHKMRLSKLSIKEVGLVQYATLSDGFSTTRTFSNLTQKEYSWRIYGTDKTDVLGKIAVCPVAPTVVFPVVTYAYSITSSCAGNVGSVSITVLNPPGDSSGQVTYSLRLSDSEKYEVMTRVVYGDDDLLCVESVGNCSNNTLLTATQLSNEAELRCKNTQKGTEFCAVSELSTIVERRLR